MDYKKEYIKTKLTELSNSYKSVAILSDYAIKTNDFKLVYSLFCELKSIFNKILSFVKNNCPKSIYEKVENLDTENLPDYFEPLKTVDIYSKILSLKYPNIETDNPKEKIMLHKMGIEFNPTEEISYLGIAKILLEEKKYPQVIKLCEYIKTISDTAPVWEILGDTYRELKDYGKSIDAYSKYLELNEKDAEGEAKLAETYEEALK